MPKSVYFVAGEASGDEHGAALMRAVRASHPTLRLSGRGGSRMRAIAGEALIDWSETAGVLGLWEVIKKYGYFRKQFHATLRAIEELRPDAVVLIDYPGFNLRLARALRKRSSTTKIIYYISPQVWAWNRGRIRAMARSLDLMLCIFPFEAELYNQSGLRTEFVGHPMIEQWATQRIDVARDPNLVALFPGSRSREIRKILPILIEVVKLLSAENPALRFEIAAASEARRREIEQTISRANFADGKVSVVEHESERLMQRAIAGIIASGTATLQACYFRLPFVLVYKVATMTYLAARIVVRVKYIGMPNVLADREIVPEFIQHRADARAIAAATRRFIEDAKARELVISEFDAIVSKLGESGASAKAARAILAEIGEIA